MTSPSPATARGSTSPTGPAGPCSSSIPASLRVVAKIAVGEHPNQIAVHPRTTALFVACASSNTRGRDRHPARHRHRDDHHRAVPQAPPRGARPTPWPSRPTARRSTSPTPTTTAWPSSTSSDPSREPGQGLHPHRLVSDGRGRHARRQDAAGRRRQGEPDQAQPDRPGRQDEDAADAAASRRLPFPYIGTTLSGALSIVAVPDDKALAAYTETVYQQLPLLRQAA